MTATLDEIFALAGTSAAELASSRGRLGTILRTQGIADTPDLDRVRALPRRAELSEHEIAALSAYLRRYPHDPTCPRCRGVSEDCPTCSGTGVIVLRPSQANALRELYDLRGLFAPMRVGSGKCLRPDTPVLRFDGAIVEAQQCAPGTLLMGPDSTPRMVTSVTRGVGPLYRIVPVKGDPWVCNDAHILTLVDSTSGRVTDVEIGDFLRWPAKRQAEAKLFQPDRVDFPPIPPPPVDPYFVGVWLGDGTKALDGIAITKPDPEIRDIVYATAEAWGLRVRAHEQPGKCVTWHLCGTVHKQNPLLAAMRDLMATGLRIPDAYRLGSRDVRAQVLAGLIDTDGHTHLSNVEIVQKHKAVADDIAFVARSLGCRVTQTVKVVNDTPYHRLKLIGDLSWLPCRIDRKRPAPRLQKKNPLRVGFRVESAGVGEYFGFTLLGADRRFLLGDFTVTHNTLVTLLAATLLGSERPVLMLPASCRDKTRREFAIYSEAWNVRLPRLLSYEELSHPDHERDLLDLRPDLLLLDEAHKARNLDAACSRRVRRAIDTIQPRPIVACLSGTLITDALMDSHHHAVWSLRDAAPVPLVAAEAERWASAVDKDVPLTARSELGALESLPGGFHAWFRGSRGVVPTPGSDCDATIEISRWRPELPPALVETIRVTEASGMRPDGEPLDPLRVPDCLCDLAGGGYWLTWDPLPPLWWLQPRRAWYGCLRAMLDEHLEHFDSPTPIVRALDRWAQGQPGPYPPSAREAFALLSAWRQVEDQFTPNSVPVWIDDAPLRQAANAMRPGTIAWVKHSASGVRLAELGIPYYPGGTDPQSARPGSPIACSIAAHGTGKNLQAWWRMLVLHPPASAEAWEQMIGRVHRQGQRMDLIEVDRIAAIAYHDTSFDRALASARNASRASGFAHKLCEATLL